MQVVPILQVLVLLLVANGAPVLAKRLMGDRFARPLDGGLRFVDGRALFGPSKTIRGIAVAIPATAASAPVVGLDWRIGAVVGAAAMAGDLFSSFVKRRLGLGASSRATGLDQVPESLFPLFACRPLLGLTVTDIAAGVVLFFVGEIVISRVMYALGVRKHPY